MNEQEDEFFLEPEVEELQAMVPEAIPIYDKPISEDQKHINFKVLEPLKREECYVPIRLTKINEDQDDQTERQISLNGSPFLDYYSLEQCVYMRCRNEAYNQFEGKKYFTGMFAHKNVFSDATTLDRTCEVADILKQYYDTSEEPLPKPAGKDLQFDSKFECGNLFAAFKVSPSEYDLVMSSDCNSIGSNQWFYFSVTNMQPNKEYTLSVVNFTKCDSLFNYGMTPTVYSMAENKFSADNERGWRRAGREVTYRKGSVLREAVRKYYYKLSFKIGTSFEKDKLLISHTYPYSHDKLQKYLSEKVNRFKDLIKKVPIGKTISKRNMEALVITQPINKKRDNRKAIIVMARQHPGETQGSFVCEGVIERLLSKSKEGEFLLKNFVFYVIPMVNPDGVIYGHYRTNLSGKDLNRKWNITEKETGCPEVINVKNFLQELSKEREIRFILDLHGHSKKLNSFFYGNPSDNPESVRIYPFIASKLTQAIYYPDCTFATEQYKRKAARVYLSYLYKQEQVYTYQSSFYAYFKDGSKVEFTPNGWRDLGGTLMTALFMQMDHEVKYGAQFKIGGNKELLSTPYAKIMMELRNNRQYLEVGEKWESGSESKPEEGQIQAGAIDAGKLAAKIMEIANAEEAEQVSRTAKIESRKGERENKSFSKPVRNIKFLEISRVNSILPDKYQLGLQPMRKQVIDTPQVLIRQSSLVLRSHHDTQTEIKIEKFPHFSKEEIQCVSLSKKDEVSNERKFSSVIKSNNRNIIFRMESFNQSARNLSSTRQSMQVQTMMTFLNEKGERFSNFYEKSIERLYENHKEVTVQYLSSNNQLLKRETPKLIQKQKGVVFPQVQEKHTKSKVEVVRKEAEVFFNGMVKKLLFEKNQGFGSAKADRKDSDRPLCIKKKEIGRK